MANGTFANRNIFTNVTFGDSAKWKLKNLLISAGLVEAGKKGAVSFESQDQLKRSLLSRNVYAKVQMREYNGQIRPEVANFVKGTNATMTTPPVQTSTPVAEAVPTAPLRPQL